MQASYNLVRCSLSAAGVAALQAGIDGVGVGWMFMVYGVLALGCGPLCWWVRRRGWAWRTQISERERAKDGDGERKSEDILTPIEPA